MYTKTINLILYVSAALFLFLDTRLTIVASLILLFTVFMISLITVFGNNIKFRQFLRKYF